MAIQLAIKESWVYFIISIRINRIFHPQVMLFSFEVTASPFISYQSRKKPGHKFAIAFVFLVTNKIN